jgi:hypothetical protein
MMMIEGAIIIVKASSPIIYRLDVISAVVVAEVLTVVSISAAAMLLLLLLSMYGSADR